MEPSDNKSYLRTLRSYFSSRKNFKILELFYMILLVIPMVLLLEVIGMGKYYHTKYVFGENIWIQLFYIILLLGVYSIFSSFLFIFFYPNKELTKQRNNIWFFNFSFMFFTFLICCSAKFWPDAFYKMNYKYAGTYELRMEEDSCLRKATIDLEYKYETSVNKEPTDYMTPFVFSLKDKKILDRFPDLRGIMFKNWQTAIVCGYKPVGIIENEVYGLYSNLYVGGFRSEYFYTDTIKYLINYTPKYFEEIILNLFKGIGWIVCIFIMQYTFFFFKQRTGFFYEILIKE